MPTWLFPAALIVLDFAAAAVYAAHHDWKLTTYWIAAGVLTICVTI